MAKASASVVVNEKLAPSYVISRLFSRTVAGVVGAAVGGALALEAKSEFNTAEAETGGARHDDSVSAVHTGNVATVVTAAGGLLVLGGLGLWLATPRDSTRVGASVGTSGSALFVQGRFW